MSLFNNSSKKDGKKGNKNQKAAAAGGSKFIAQNTKGAAGAKKPIKTGGSRGS